VENVGARNDRGKIAINVAPRIFLFQSRTPAIGQQRITYRSIGSSGMQLTSVLVGLVACVVGVHALQSNMATGFACLNGFYGADMAGAPTSLTSVTYSPLGVCVPTSQYPGVGGVIFSADANNKLYASYFATSSCGAQTAQLTLTQLTTAGVVTGTSTTVATSTAGVSDVQCDTAALTAVGISAVGMPYGLTATGPLAPFVGQVSPDDVLVPSPTC